MNDFSEINLNRERNHGQERAEWMKNMNEFQMDSSEDMHLKYNEWTKISSDFGYRVNVYYNIEKQQMAMVFSGLPGISYWNAIEIDKVSDQTDAYFKSISILAIIMNAYDWLLPKITVTEVSRKYIERADIWAKEYEVTDLFQNASKQPVESD
jgi:hypothetical protein